MSKVSLLISFSVQLALVDNFFFFDCTGQDNFLFPVNNCRKSCNLQKKLDVIHILFCRTQQKFLWKKPQKTLQNFYYTSGDVLGEDNHTFFVQGLFFVWWSIKVLMIFPMSLNFNKIQISFWTDSWKKKIKSSKNLKRNKN